MEYVIEALVSIALVTLALWGIVSILGVSLAFWPLVALGALTTAGIRWALPTNRN